MKAAVALIALALVAAPFLPRTTRTMLVPATPDPMATVTRMERQAAALSVSMDRDITRYFREVFPLEWALLPRARDPWLARVAAWALVVEAERWGMGPRLLTSIIQEENPWLVTDTTSSAGAVGWGQIMPLHAGQHDPCGDDLRDGPTSVCYSASISRQYFGRALRRALVETLNGYSGCVSKPGCELYAERVLGRLN